MSQPPGFSHPQFSSHVCRLNKAIYGLRQSPCAWYSRLSYCLTDLGFTISTADPSLFLRTTGKITNFVVYVDDLLITGSSQQTIQDLILALCTNFPITDLGKFNYFLGVEATYTLNRNTTLICCTRITCYLPSQWSLQWPHPRNSAPSMATYLRIPHYISASLAHSSTSPSQDLTCICCKQGMPIYARPTSSSLASCQTHP